MLSKVWLWLGALGALILSIVRVKNWGKKEAIAEINKEILEDVKQNQDSRTKWNNASRDELINGVLDGK